MSSERRGRPSFKTGGDDISWKRELRESLQIMADAEKKPTPVIIHLSGDSRGKTLRLSGDRILVGPAPDADVRLSKSDLPGETILTEPGQPLATLERQGEAYELKASPESDLRVNDRKVNYVVLGSGDVLQVGENGPILRYRVHPPGTGASKTLWQAVVDCADVARYSGKNPIHRAGIFLSSAPRELTTQTSRSFRVAVVIVLAAILTAAGFLWYQNRKLEARLEKKVAEFAGLSDLLKRADENALSADDLAAIQRDLETRMSGALARVEAMETRLGARAEVIASASPSVVFLQGSYGFRDPESGKPLRFTGVGPDGRPLREPGGAPSVALGGAGPEVEILYTGTAFVASESGELLTNRHVAAPWGVDPAAQAIVARGLAPVLKRFIGYFPGVEEPVTVEAVRQSEDADVALLRCSGLPEGVRPLTLSDAPPRPGDEIIVLGYPTGMRALLARTDPAVVRELMERGTIDFWTLARELADGGNIAPLATVGVVGQITASTVAYDAETTHGGSGGPVLGLDGRVVAVNAAILPEFGGSNLGVPASRAARILE